MIARFVAPDAEITLRSPPPLDVPLAVERTEHDGVEVYHGETLVAQGRTIDLRLDVPAPPSLEEAEAARARYAGLDDHAFPHCFVCGTDRAPGDGLRIWAGRVVGRDVWASPWRPDDSVPTVDGILEQEIIWSAMDCPGAWAVERATQAQPVVLGRMSARLERPAHNDLTYIAMGWAIGEDGRKLYSGTALFDDRGCRYGFALQTWIVIG
jgi:hypothetical protein